MLKSPVQKHREALTKRLIAEMKTQGYKASRGHRSGVDPEILRHVTKVSSLGGVDKWLDGTAYPSIEKRVLIAKWLNVRLGWLEHGELPKYKV